MLNRTAQCGTKIEAAEGTEEVLVAADFRGNFSTSNHRYATGEYDRALERGALSMSPKIKGANSLTITREEELVGGTATEAAPWHTRLRAMGFAVLPVSRFPTTGPVGTLVIGELVGNNASQALATKLAIVVGIAGSTIDLVPISGASFASLDTVNGYGVGGGSRTLNGAATTKGFGFRPMSENSLQTPPSVTDERRLGGQRHTLIGGRGTGGLTLKWNEPAKLRSEITGVPLFDVTAGVRTPKAGAVLSPAAFTSPPPVCKGVALTFGVVGSPVFTPIATEISIAFGNTLAQRETIGTGIGGNYESGYLSTRITGREVTATIDPEHVLPAAGFDYIDAMQRGQTFAITAVLGALTGANGQVVVIAPAAQLTGDYEPGDRNGLTTSPLNVLLTGTQDDELIIAHVFA